MPERPPPPDVAVSRRALAGLAAASALTVLTACSGDGTAGPVLPVDPVADPDVGLAVEAWAAEMSVLLQVRSARRRHRQLRGRLAAMEAVHAAHVTVLERAVPVEDLPAPPSTPGPPRRPAAALELLGRAEDGLARAQARRAVRAGSGQLARVLAGAAAAAAQQSHLLRVQA